MSATPAQSNMTGQEAHNLLVREVYAPVFFQKLAADYGIVPDNEEQASDLLKMGAQLANVEERQVIHSADSKTRTIKEASAALERLVNGGTYAPVQDARVESWIDKTAADLATAPEIREAFITFQTALAQASA